MESDIKRTKGNVLGPFLSIGVRTQVQLSTVLFFYQIIIKYLYDKLKWYGALDGNS